MPGGGRRGGDWAAPGGGGRHRHRQVAGLPRPGRRLGQEGGGGHGHQGPAGPAGREGPADGGRRTGRRVLLRRVEGSQQLSLPSAGGRGRRPRLPAAVRRRRCRPGPGTGRHRTAGHNAARHNAARHSAARHSAARHSAARHSAARHSAARHSTGRHRTAGHRRRAGDGPWRRRPGAGRSRAAAAALGREIRDRRPRRTSQFEPHPRAWAMVSVGPRECPGAFRCPSGNRCFAEQARARAAAGRRGGGQHPPLRRPPGQRRRRPPRARRGGLRRGPRGGGGHDRRAWGPRSRRAGSGRCRPGPHPAPGRRRRAALEDLAETAEELQGALVGRVGARVLRDPDSSGGLGPSRQATGEPAGRERSLREPPVVAPEGQGEGAGEDRALARLLELASTRVERVSVLLRRDGRQPGGRRGRRRPAGPGPERRRSPLRGPGPAGRPDQRRGGLGGRDLPGPGAPPLADRRRGGRWPSCSGARPRPCSPAPPSRSGSPSGWAWSGSRSTS